ncbi:hypothetical protein E9993_00935 [Labilibacter sediminis]|nr:hypothetical protein E9993_00935 [Labilibacter sediminis]
MKTEIACVDFVLTGSELLALLKESAEIKKEKPLYNKAQRKGRYHFGLYSFKDRKGYVRFNIAKNDGRTTPLASFDSLKEAKEYLFGRVEEYRLCQKLSGLSDSTGSCFQYQVKICNGACIEEESAIVYNKRAQLLINFLSFSDDNFIIIDKGRDIEENAIVVVQDGRYLGYGWIEKDRGFSSLDEIISDINLNNDNQDARMIIKRQLSKNKKLKIIKF